MIADVWLLHPWKILCKVQVFVDSRAEASLAILVGFHLDNTLCVLYKSGVDVCSEFIKRSAECSETANEQYVHRASKRTWTGVRVGKISTFARTTFLQPKKQL